MKRLSCSIQLCIAMMLCISPAFAEMLERDVVGIDAVTGAAHSSQGIIDAVEAAPAGAL